jgi:hypothetical protein
MTPVDSPSVPERDDDMHDPRHDRDLPFPLGAYLRICDPCAEGREEPCLRQDFDDADRDALLGQQAFATAVRRGVTLGLSALLVGLLQYVTGERLPEDVQPWALGVEAAYTIVALGYVLHALITGKQEHWLNERFKAERLRLLKFKVLIDPRLWLARENAPDQPDPLAFWRGRIETGRQQIANQPEELLDALTVSDALPDLPATEDSAGVDASTLERLLGYYRRKRLDSQLAYFAGKARKKRSLADNNLLSPIFFFVGVGFSLCNLVLEFATRGVENERIRETGALLVCLSFAIPLIWSALRTRRSAHEVSRNVARSHARHAALSEIRDCLNKATSGPRAQWDTPMIFGYLYTCENVLAADQHEWIRLMREAEWYG